ncbi:MAG: MBL fold metallo-hydrolase [Rhodospirillales bacterium]|nr:MBL fold metallo-hydrolase [Rhodospirillales bacterium]
MAHVTEIAPDIFRLSAYNKQANFQFNSFLVRDAEPVLVHTNLRAAFGEIRDAVAHLIDPAKLRYIAFSHFESDECGSLNDWLALAPAAEPLCSVVGARVTVNDFAIRPARTLAAGEALATGAKRLRVINTPHVPHGWDACLFFEETGRTLFVSDLMGHNGDVEPVITGDIVGRSRAYTAAQMTGPMAHSTPYTAQTKKIVLDLAGLEPKTLAAMHGSSFAGDGAGVLADYAVMLEETIGRPMRGQ